MKSFLIANPKGGSGKSTLATNLAGYFARCGHPLLLANHGLLVAGRNLDEALTLAVELEELCGQYWRACQLGHPVLLTSDEMRAVLEQFRAYGQQ